MGVQRVNWLVLHASPRSGNCARAGELLAGALTCPERTVTRLALRDFCVAPCIACGLCDRLPDSCSLDAKASKQPDDAAMLLHRMRNADALVLVAPIYFYGLPAQFKALVDRAQRFWAWGFPSTPPRPAFVVFSAAREQGERLCEGSLLSLRPFLRLLGFELIDHLELRGLDGPSALSRHVECERQLCTWGGELPQRKLP